MKKYLKCFGVCAMIFGLVFCYGSPVKATTFTIDLVDGDWANAVNVNPTPDTPTTIVNSGPTGGTSTIRWGTPLGTNVSGYTFESRLTPFDVTSDGTAFALGDFTHENWQIANNNISSVDLLLALDSNLIFNISTSFHIIHNETPNIYSPVDNPLNNDIVTINNPIVNQLFTYGGNNYYFNLLGFSQDGGSTITTVFSTVEEQSNVASLFGKITEIPVDNPVPEPSTFFLLGSALVGLGILGKKRLKK